MSGNLRKWISILAHVGLMVLIGCLYSVGGEEAQSDMFGFMKTVLVIMILPFIYIHTSRSGFLNKIFFVLIFLVFIGGAIGYTLLGISFIFPTLMETEEYAAEYFAFCTTMIVWIIVFKKTLSRILDDEEPTVFSTIVYYLFLVGTPFLLSLVSGALVEITVIRIIAKVYTAGCILLVLSLFIDFNELKDSPVSTGGGYMPRYELEELLIRAHMYCDYDIVDGKGSGRYVVLLNGSSTDARNLMRFIRENTDRDCSNVSVTYRTDI